MALNISQSLQTPMMSREQRALRERNWQSAKFTNFQLPDPAYAHEAHTQCVYILQQRDNYVISGGQDKSIRIWNIDTERLVLPPLHGHTASVLALQFDHRPGRDFIVSSGVDCQIIVWRFSTGEIIRRIENAHSESVLCLRFDDRYLVTGSKDKTVKVWDLKAMTARDNLSNQRVQFQSPIGSSEPTGSPFLVSTFCGHSAAVNGVDIRGDLIVSSSGDRSLNVWDVTSKMCIKTVNTHMKGITCVQFDGRYIITGSSDQTIQIFDLQSSMEVACLTGHTALVRTVKASWDNLPMGQDAESGDKSTSSPGLHSVAPSLPEIIVSGSYDGEVIIWKKNTLGSWDIARQLNPGVALHSIQNQVGNSEDGDGHADGRPNTQSSQRRWVFHVLFDHRRILCCGQNGEIVGWDFSAGDEAIEAPVQDDKREVDTTVFEGPAEIFLSLKF
jgi:WD40 repeat protein